MYRYQSVVLRAVANFSVSVVTPSPHRSVGAQGGVGILPGRNCHHIAETAYLDRTVRLDRRSVTQLAEDVLTPGPHCAVRPQREAVRVSGRDRRHSVEPGYLDWRELAVRGAVA